MTVVPCEDKKNVSISLSPPPPLLVTDYLTFSQLANQQRLPFLLLHYQIRSSDALKNDQLGNRPSAYQFLPL